MNEIQHIDFKKAETLFESRKTVMHTINFIYFLVFWTAFNSIMNFIPDNSVRILGLSLDICLMIDVLITNAPVAMIVIGLCINLLILSFFVYLAARIKKRELWAYKLALILYLLDTILIFAIPFEGKIGLFLMHLFIIWIMWSEIKEYSEYFKLEKNLYLPDWALSEKSYVLFVKKEDFELQSDSASQIIFYKKAVHCQEENKPFAAVEYYTQAINIWKNIPIVQNKDKDWYALALMNRAILGLSIRSRNNQAIMQDFLLAYINLKTVIKEDVQLQRRKKYKYSNYDFVSEYFAQCSYYLLFQISNYYNDNDFTLKYSNVLGFNVKTINALYLSIYNCCFQVFTTYKINTSNNAWALKIQNELPAKLNINKL
jgi:hypothetical protein